jgi:UDP-N-acetylglucosamine--N-acetylmuramyl-(pentapeptide) pyrophosphoryl-undecaprenol N-acetylglucosamine transferase
VEKKHCHSDKPGGLRLVVAGGGTGGHLFPGIAVAQAFICRDDGNQVLFINAGRALETSVLARLGWPQQTITIEGIKGRSRWHQLTAALKIPTAVWQSGCLLKAFKPHVVLGVGGYSAGPVVAAAWRRGIPTALHEQNQLPGVTNRLVGRLVDRVYLSFVESRVHFNPAKVRISGNPVRDEIVTLAACPAPPEQDRPFTVLVVGGSQGAHAINQAVLDALPALKGRDLQLVHQTGEQDQARVQQAYAREGVPARVQAFFDDMAAQYRHADLIICRAGATTVAEITVLGKAALFVPFPHAADDHQTKNAQALVDAGAAEMITQKALNGKVLAQSLERLMQAPGHLAQMARMARELGRPDAARVIVDDIYALLKKKVGE